MISTVLRLSAVGSKVYPHFAAHIAEQRFCPCIPTAHRTSPNISSRSRHYRQYLGHNLDLFPQPVSCSLSRFQARLLIPRLGRSTFDRVRTAGDRTRRRRVSRLCQLSRLLIDDVSTILPRAQAVSRMPSAIAALRMCCQRRVAAGTRWRMRDLQRRKFRSSSWQRQYRLADPVLFSPSIGRHRPLMPR